MSLLRFSPGSLAKAIKLNFNLSALVLALGSGFGIVTAYLIVTGNWLIALGLLAALPALIILHRYPFLAPIVWLALAPFLMTTETAIERRAYWVIHRGLPPATIGIIVLSALLRTHSRRLPRLGWVELAMGGYLVVSLLSILLLGNEPAPTVIHFYDRVFSPMCLYLIVRLSAPEEKDLRRMMPVIFFLGASQSIIGIVSWAAPQVLPGAWLGMEGSRTTGSLVNPSTYTTALVFAGLLLLQAAVHHKPGLVRTLYLGTFVLTLFCVFLSFSRASWLGGILVALGVIYLYPKFMGRLGLITLPILIILSGGLLVTQLDWARQRFYSEESGNSALSRLPTFLAAYRMFEEKPLLGWGYGNFDYYDRRFQGRVANFDSDNKDHASHNVYLQLLAEQGLIGFTLFVAPALAWLNLAIRAWPRMPAEGSWSRKLLVILWLILLNQIVVNNFTNTLIVFGLGLGWVTLGLIASLVQAYLAPGGRVERVSTRQAAP